MVKPNPPLDEHDLAVLKSISTWGNYSVYTSLFLVEGSRRCDFHLNEALGRARKQLSSAALADTDQEVVRDAVQAMASLRSRRQQEFFEANKAAKERGREVDAIFAKETLSVEDKARIEELCQQGIL
jgi:hypothetical protein